MNPGKTGSRIPETHGRSILRESIEMVGMAVVFAVVLRVFVLQAFYIPSTSMENTLLPDDRILVNKLAYAFSPVQIGDLVVFHGPLPGPWASPKDYVKRILGLPGDRLSLRGARLIRNGLPLDEPYLKEGMDDGPILHAHQRWLPGTDEYQHLASSEEIHVPEGYCFVMGDNRNHSHDSRFFGFVALKDIVGRALLVYWPLSRFGFLH